MFLSISINLLQKMNIMKTINYFLAASAFLAIATMTSCSDSDTIECHECHIAYDGPNGEIEVPILNSGEEDFCGDDLANAEAPGFSYAIEETIIGMDTIPAGTYTDIHCEEHADH